MFFPVHERFWFCLVQVSTTQFCSFPDFLMARVSDGTNVPISSAPASSSNFGSSNSSGSDLNGTGTRSGITTDEKLDAFLLQFTQFKEQIAQIHILRIGCPVWIHISRRHLRISRPDLQRWKRISITSLHVCARSRHMQPSIKCIRFGTILAIR